MMTGKRSKQRDVEMGSDLQRLQKMARDLYKGHEIEREVLLDLLEFFIEKVAEQPSLQGGYADLPPSSGSQTSSSVNWSGLDRAIADLRPPQGEAASTPTWREVTEQYDKHLEQYDEDGCSCEGHRLL